MQDVAFTLFTDTGGILLLDPAHAGALDEEFAERLNVVLDPEGLTDQTAARDGDWPRAWAEAVSDLRRMSAGGLFALLLSGEGTFHVRVQSGDLDEEERGRVAGTFEESVRVSSGELAFTDGLEFFDDELEDDGAVHVGVPEGFYTVRIHHLNRHPSVTPTVGVHGSEEHPALVLQLTPAHESEATRRDGEEFPRLTTSYAGYEEPRAGWDCYAQVTGVEGGAATLELMLTETVYAGHARMSVPEGEELKAGDYVLVRLVEDTGGYWKAEWQG
ncbi:MAG TPA: hypothetical protein VER08_08810 [Pyrinomonadaceae bacterium]|nr:hypothetical protein [Pyrinomonadaceae bacterium]